MKCSSGENVGSENMAACTCEMLPSLLNFEIWGEKNNQMVSGVELSINELKSLSL